MSCTCFVVAEWPESRTNITAPGQGFPNRRRPISDAVNLWVNIVGLPEWKFTVYPNQHIYHNHNQADNPKSIILLYEGIAIKFFEKKKISFGSIRSSFLLFTASFWRVSNGRFFWAEVSFESVFRWCPVHRNIRFRFARCRIRKVYLPGQII